MAKKITAEGEIVDVTLALPAPFFKTPFNHDTDAESARLGLLCRDPSKTQQHQAEEADINTIVKRFNISGQLPQIPLPPSIADFSETFDFQTAMNTLNQAKAAFGALPAEIRSTFNNNPHAYVSYVDAAIEAGDLDQLRKWGVAVPAPPEPEVPFTPPPSQSPAGKTADKPS